jgi:hypothetical protein
MSFFFKDARPYYFAFTHPWSYEQNCLYLKKLEERFEKSEHVHFKRHVLAKSLENRDIELVVVSARANLKKQ